MACFPIAIATPITFTMTNRDIVNGKCGDFRSLDPSETYLKPVW